MEVRYSIAVHPSVHKEDLPKLDKMWRRKIRDSVRSKLTTAPELFGVPLRQTLGGLRKLRIGDYRVIYRIEKKVVQILIISHRSVVYKDILKRIH